MTSPLTCPRCGAPLDPSSRPGLCAKCLLAAGLRSEESDAELSAAGDERAKKRAPPTIEELAPHFPSLALEELIGQGGMGAVYRAVQRGLERPVALKILHGEYAGEAGFAERFAREARTLASLDHKNLVRVFEYGHNGPHYFFVMELVEGANLRTMLRAGTVSARDALAIVGQVCEALQYAHDQGVVHRDIKPENILVDRTGAVKILDFGLSKMIGARIAEEHLTGPQQVMGTPHYMAPEQWEHPREVDHRADIYSLGVVFYELLTGELPVGRFAPPSRRVRIDVRLDEVVLRTLEREPDLRYQQASAVKVDVDRIRASPRPTSTREPLPTWLIALIAAYCLISLGVALWIAAHRLG